MNILIFGLGSIAKKHILAIRKIYPMANIYAFRSSKKAEIYQDIINIYNLNEIISKIDFIVISNPTKIHEETILNSLKFNCPLFIEKPPLSNLINIDLILDEIKKSGLSTYVACNLRFYPALEFIKKYLYESNKTINEVNIYCGSYLPNWRPGINFRNIYSVSPEMGGGVHLDLFHEIDYTYWIFGKPQRVSSIKRNVSSLKIDSFDYANYLFEYNNYAVNIILNYYRKDTKRTLEILFDQDTWLVDLLNNKITDQNNNLIFQDKKFTLSDSYLKQMEYFTQSIHDNKPILNSLPESIEVLKLILHDGYIK